MMDFRQINDILRNEAIGCGLCSQWQGDWKTDWDAEKLLDKYKEGIDFCMNNDYPHKDFIKSNFPIDLLREKGILVDDNWSLLNKRVSVLLGNTATTARYNGWNVAAIYATHDAEVHVRAKNRSHVIIHLYGNARAVIDEIKDDARVVIIKRRDTASATDNTGKAIFKS